MNSIEFGTRVSQGMFTDWLKQTKLFQLGVYNFDFDAMSEEEQRKYIHEMTFAAAAELFELSNEYSWKSWAKVKPTNRDAVVGEAIDVLHFVANVLCAVGCTDAELREKYLNKMAINAARQQRAEGYSTVEGKCPSCRRALDDPAVTCTEEKCADA